MKTTRCSINLLVNRTKRKMRKYKVIVEGSNLSISLDGKAGKYGFFTTRFIEAPNMKDAETLALTMLRDELKSAVLNDISDPPVISVDEIQEINDFDRKLFPGSGFTWYELTPLNK